MLSVPFFAKRKSADKERGKVFIIIYLFSRHKRLSRTENGRKGQQNNSGALLAQTAQGGFYSKK